MRQQLARAVDHLGREEDRRPPGHPASQKLRSSRRLQTRAKISLEATPGMGGLRLDLPSFPEPTPWGLSVGPVFERGKGRSYFLPWGRAWFLIHSSLHSPVSSPTRGAVQQPESFTFPLPALWLCPSHSTQRLGSCDRSLLCVPR